jgi:hypothetical protein
MRRCFLEDTTKRVHLWRVLGALIATTIVSAQTPSRPEREDSAGTNWIAEIQKSTRNSIVFITAKVTLDNGYVKEFGGTGFIVDNCGHILTCSHVVPKSGEYGKNIEVLGAIGGRYEHQYKLYVGPRDPESDLVVLQLPQSVEAKPLDWAPAEATVGTDIVALGFPEDQDLQPAEGIIQATAGDQGNWKTSANFNHGMSGGPVFNKSGKILGFVEGAQEELNGVYYLRPISFATNLLGQIHCSLHKPTPTPKPRKHDPRLTAERVWQVVLDIAQQYRDPPTPRQVEDMIPDELFSKDPKEKGIQIKRVINNWEGLKNLSSLPPIQNWSRPQVEVLDQFKRYTFKISFYPQYDSLGRLVPPAWATVRVGIDEGGEIRGWDVQAGQPPY